MTQDLEKQIGQVMNGYPSLASFVAYDQSQHSTSIFRRFDNLSARNLLHLQSQVAELEARQRCLDEEDFAADDDLTIARCRDWGQLMSASTMEPETGANRAQKDEDNRQRHAAQVRIELAKDIQAKLAEYQQALINQATLLAMRPPTKHDYSVFRQYFDHSLLPNNTRVYKMLQGNSGALYDDLGDLDDRILRFLREWLPWIFNSKKVAGTTLGYASDEWMRRTAAVVSILTAAGLLYGAILHFYYVRQPHIILGMIAGYTTAFAVAVGLLTNAKRSEVFAACAAYAAVIVVFISNPLDRTNTVDGG
ncbi:hypothetical protein H2200_001911 [Cladophialophora chaetospira]|uniref:DUF6594 domain-containing protein n=1 Tax=Cladophialophora chaetospira TaxID=386627 RepID=A0AA39CPI6_9EURO|nr:hypothetical protein H2200_001911 [Cladophialophora chaetospira]